MALIIVFKGVSFKIASRTYTVLEHNKHETILVDLLSNLIVPRDTRKLSDALTSGVMEITGYRDLSLIPRNKLIYLSIEARLELLRRMKYILKCYINNTTNLSTKELIRYVAEEISDKNPPSCTVVKCWIKFYQEYEVNGQMELLISNLVEQR